LERFRAPSAMKRAWTGRVSARHVGCRSKACVSYIAPPDWSVPASARTVDASLMLDVVKNHRCGPTQKTRKRKKKHLTQQPHVKHLTQQPHVKNLTQQPHVKNQVSESLTPAADSRIGIYLIHHGKQLSRGLPCLLRFRFALTLTRLACAC
jgi:hypothetical protein